LNKAITICLIIVGLINFIPTIAIISAQKLEAAYSIKLISNDLIILLRHRALLFGILGGFILYSVKATSYQGAAMIMAGISMLGYVVLMFTVGGYNEALYKILIIDVVGIVILSLAVIFKYIIKSSR